VIELWEQHWKLNPDGSTVYREKRHVRLNSDRSYGEFADPRITYNTETDQLEVLVARTRLPDGRYRELPDYARIVVSPDASAGWPAFASICQQLLVMSGIEPGCVVELEYQITSRAGARPFLAADVRVDHRYPIRQRIIRLEAPSEVPLRVVASRLPAGSQSSSDGRTWSFGDLPAAVDEPQSPPWQARCPRMAFSTAGLASTWLKHRHAQLEAAADQSEQISKLAAEWTREQKDPSDKMRALRDKLSARFNFVEFDPSWRPAAIRPASEVIRSNYGLPEEAAAALLALARAAGLTAMPGILVDNELWNHEVPQDGMVAAYVVLLIVGRTGDVRMASDSGGGSLPVVDTGDYPEIWDPRHGRIAREGRWAGYTLLPVPDVIMPRTTLEEWTRPEECRCQITGKVTVAEDANWTGQLSLKTTGLFVSSEGLRTSDAQKGRIAALLIRTLPDVNVESFSVKTLGVGEFEATANVKSAKPLRNVAVQVPSDVPAGPAGGKLYCLQLPADGPFLIDVPLPLAVNQRDNPVRLPGPFTEELALTVEWPENWSLEIQPDELPQSSGQWGLVRQEVQTQPHGLTLHRHTRVTVKQLPPGEFQYLRQMVNELRSEHSRTLVLRSAPGPRSAGP